MAKIKNISPLGDLIIPALDDLVIKSGEVADVPNDAAISLLAQTDNWVAADKAAASIATPAEPTPAEQN
jgi:hypothetical protein